MKTVSSILGFFNSQMRHRGAGSVFPQKPEILLIYGLPHPWNRDTDMFCSRHWKAQHCSLSFFFFYFPPPFFFFFFLSFLPKESVSCQITFPITSGSNPWWLPTYPNWLSSSKSRQGVWTDKQQKTFWFAETRRKHLPPENNSQLSLSQLLLFLLWAIKTGLKSLWVPEDVIDTQFVGPAGPSGIGTRIRLGVFWSVLMIKAL